MNWWNSKEQGSALMYILMMIKEIEFNIRCELHLVRECCVNLRISLILKSSIIQEHLRGISAQNTEDPSSTLQSFCSKTEVKPHTLLSFFFMGLLLLRCKWSLYVHLKRVKGRPHICLFMGVCGRFGVRLSLEHERVTVLQERFNFLILKGVGFLNIFPKFSCS